VRRAAKEVSIMNDAESAYAPPQEIRQRSTLLLWLLVIAMGILLAAMAVAIFGMLIWVRQVEMQRFVAVELEELADDQPLTAEATELQVNITKEGDYIVSDRTLDEASLMALLHRLAINNPGSVRVNICAHRDVPFRYPLTVIGICQHENCSYYCTVWQGESFDEPPSAP
jgi:biopolymer transport protein ExbD